MHNLDHHIRQNRQLVKTLTAKLGDYIRSGQRWIEFQCPYCDDQGYHLGINLRTMSVRCLRCEAKPEVSELLKLRSSYKPISSPIKPTEAAAIERSQDLFLYSNWEELFIPFKSYSATSGRSKIMAFAHEYLKERKVNIPLLDKIGYKYGLVHTSRLRGRIVFISTVDNRPVYYQARAIPKVCTSGRKTLNPAPDEGWLDKGHVLFGYDWIRPETKTIVLVEGVLDAAAATSPNLGIIGIPLLGKVISAMQLLKLKRFKDKKFVVALDQDAKIEIISLALQLHDLGFSVWPVLRWPIGPTKDPADFAGQFIKVLPHMVEQIGEDISAALLRAELVRLKERGRREIKRRLRKRL